MDEQSAARTARGHCLCGAVQFELSGEPRLACYCHCTTCRRAHGAGAVGWACYREEQLTVRAGEANLARYATENASTRSFCGRCGTTMFFGGDRWAGEVHVAIGTLEDDDAPRPRLHAYADRAPSWDPIHDDLPRYGGPDGSTPL